MCRKKGGGPHAFVNSEAEQQIDETLIQAYCIAIATLIVFIIYLFIYLMHP